MAFLASWCGGSCSSARPGRTPGDSLSRHPRVRRRVEGARL